MQAQIDEVVKKSQIKAEEVLSALGTTDLPECLEEAARSIQDELCAQYGVQRALGGLQGPLIEAIAKEMQDPDDDVAAVRPQTCGPAFVPKATVV